MPIQQVILVLSPFDNSFFLKISGKFTISGYHLSSCELLFVHVFQRLESYRWFDLGSIQCTFFVHLEGQRLLSFDCIDAQLGDSSLSVLDFIDSFCTRQWMEEVFGIYCNKVLPFGALYVPSILQCAFCQALPYIMNILSICLLKKIYRSPTRTIFPLFTDKQKSHIK